MTEWQKLNRFEQTFIRIVWVLSPMGLVALGLGLLTLSRKTAGYVDIKNILNGEGAALPREPIQGRHYG